MSLRSRRVWLAVLAVSGSIVCATSSPAGGAAHSSWSPAVHIDGHNSLIDVSCPGVHLCVVGGATGVFVSTNPRGGATTWSRSVAPPARPGTAPAVYGVSCPSTSFCVAVGQDSVLTSSDPAGGPAAWQSTRLSLPKGQQLSRVSCASSALCVVVAVATHLHQTGHKPPSVGYVVASTKPSGTASAWRQRKFTEAPVSVECTRPHLCLVGTRSGNVLSSTHPTRGPWTSAHVFGKKGYEADINSVSCSSLRYCLATSICSCGASVLLTTSHPARGGAFRWPEVVYHPQNAGVILGIDCVVRRQCVVSAQGPYSGTGTFQDMGTVYTGTGPKAGQWTHATVRGSGGSVSCASSKLCVLLGDQGRLFVGHL